MADVIFQDCSSHISINLGSFGEGYGLSGVTVDGGASSTTLSISRDQYNAIVNGLKKLHPEAESGAPVRFSTLEEALNVISQALPEKKVGAANLGNKYSCPPLV